jgi:hypothetical protein
MINAHLAPFGEWGVAGIAQRKAEDRALLEASEQKRLTGNKPPTPHHVYRVFWKTIRGKPAKRGAWVLRSPQIPKPKPDKNEAAYQYAVLAALHDAVCTDEKEAERADPIWPEPHTRAANADAFKVIEWRALKRAVSQPRSISAMVAQVSRALARVETDLGAGDQSRTLAVGQSGPKGPPEKPTWEVSLRHAAVNWFDKADETLTGMIMGGSVRATRISKRLWIFDSYEVDARGFAENASDFDPSSGPGGNRRRRKKVSKGGGSRA